MDEGLTLRDSAHQYPKQAAPMRVRAVLDARDTVLLGLATIAMMVALYAIFIYAPTERVMGDVQRIFYVHVSLAWLSYLAFFVVFVCSIVYLWRRDERKARRSARRRPGPPAAPSELDALRRKRRIARSGQWPQSPGRQFQPGDDPP